MLEQLPSLRGFQPQWLDGGSSAFFLPLVYDLVALGRPKLVVTLGYREGQVHFAFCQAAREAGLETHCIALRRDLDAKEEEDEGWMRGLIQGKEQYGETSELLSRDWGSYAAELGERSVDLLFIDEIDSGKELSEILERYESLLSPAGVILFHGLFLERSDAPRVAWEHWARQRHHVCFAHGLRLGVATVTARSHSLPENLKWLFQEERFAELSSLYLLAAERNEARAQASVAAREVASLRARQNWIDAILADRREAQKIMEEQRRMVAEVQPRFEAWQRDRARAQLVMDAQLEQVKHWTAVARRFEAERDRYKQQAKEQKEILKIARAACRKKGRCFELPQEREARKQRKVSERIWRELKRVPANLFGRKGSEGAAVARKPASRNAPPGVVTEADRYAAWIAEHEPDADALEAQRQENAAGKDAPKITLLLPVLNTPEKFLSEMLESIRAQTFSNWELCLVDAGSTEPATRAVLEQQTYLNETRFRMRRLSENLGIAENTNRALEMATGDFCVCVDHDDRLAPFALHALARAIAKNPEADIIYSDEDRCDINGKRHSPFFKPEWSPELLISFMYLGHLTAYRRSLMLELGGFRKEFDLSQDYDFALRATERAREIQHLPQVLYHWREHPASGSAGGKPEARKSNLAALEEAMRRRNLPAEIIAYPSANRARLLPSRTRRVSIIVSTDSPVRAKACAKELPRNTSYPDFEVIIVTNSDLAAKLEASQEPHESVKFVSYDKPFNFSDKCNVGAAAASGELLIFFNDDVVPNEANWIQELVEQLENPEVGAVAPKLLYESGKIQHAGLVTGVRGLVGTACHQWDADSSRYSNFAQSLRDVSALSAACLAMRKEDFFRLGQFDAANTPIAHSDLDLCFKVREAGLRCVYTPFVTLLHQGHASIGAAEEAATPPPPDKASVYLLKRWAGYTSHDPYYPQNIREWLYADSPTPLQMWGKNKPVAQTTTFDLLIVTHDLSWSGAPLIVLEIARWCQENGFFVAVLSPERGPLENEFARTKIPLIVDPLVTQEHDSFKQLAREFDCVVASTIFGASVVRAAKKAAIPHLWWIHEGQVAEPYLAEDRGMRAALGMANLIVTPDTRSAQVYQPFAGRDIRVLNYGIPDPLRASDVASKSGGSRVKFLLLGTVEQRKGQRVFLQALQKLSGEVLAQAEFQIIGRSHDAEIVREIDSAARKFQQLAYRDSVTHEQALEMIRESDVMLSCSWDETGPLILMEALALGKPILSTNVGAVAEHLSSSNSGLFFRPGDSDGLARAINRLISEPDLRVELQRRARTAYEEHFTFERFAQGFAQLVREAAEIAPLVTESSPALAQS